MVPIFPGRVLDGGLMVLDRPHDYGRHLRSLKGKFVEVIIRQQRTKRSNQANRRYWALLTVAAKELGYDDPEELHEGVAMKFLRIHDEERGGLMHRRRTPNLDTAEFAEYVNQAERFFVIDLHLDLSEFYQDFDPSLPGVEAA